MVKHWLSILCLATSATVFAGAAKVAMPTTPEAADSLEAKWGIKVVALRLTAAGQLLDFRYKVTNPSKAAPLLDRRYSPVLTDQASGRMFAVPAPAKVGPLRSAQPPEKNRTYFILFGNPGAFVKSGNKVTVTIGKFEATDLEVGTF